MSCTVECVVIGAAFTIPKLMLVLQALTAVALESGAGIEEKIQIKEEKTILDSVGKKLEVDLVLENAFGDRIGIRDSKPSKSGSKAKPFEFLFENPKSKTALATVDKIRQAYSRMQIIDQLKRKGYQKVKEERLANGAIRLVVEKWQ